MQLDKLELDLQPRPNAQALDLGFSLLRQHARDTYFAWLALWLPVIVGCTALACIWREYAGIFLLAAWWVRPMLERAPLYVLSRQVFGEDVSWREAVRAWPRQLGGGWFYLLTWGRFFCAGRGLYQPIWQLEGARGKVAAERRKILSKNRTGRSAVSFGAACANFEGILQLGLLFFIGIFISDEGTVNPFILLRKFANEGNGFAPDLTALLLTFLGAAIAGAIVGPIFTACGFTLYLNRRATLEAWDLEIALRQIKPPQRPVVRGNASSKAASFVALLCGAALLLPMLLSSPPVNAQSAPANASTANAGKCQAPDFVQERLKTRQPTKSETQTNIRHEVDQLYDTDDLRGYTCEYQWVPKHPDKPEDAKKPPKVDHSNSGFVGGLSTVLKVVLIAMLIGVVAAFLYRYRDQLGAFSFARTPVKATEIAGMDIRPESLPDDVAKQVAELWRLGQRRAALALLYRATVSRLVNDNHLKLTQGATEGDCLRAVLQAQRRQELSETRSSVTRAVTDIWLRAAYADRWPDDAAIITQCAAWNKEFDTLAMAEVA
jgi:hypothetical protein